MRIAGGEFKGRIIKVPHIPNLRPTTERMREAIFSALGADILGVSVADLFCGSGALGLEALSRGAEEALFIDSRKVAVAAAKQNIKALDLLSRSQVLTMNVFHIRPRQVADKRIIFADPPYRKGYCQRLASLLSLQKSAWNGILILEHESEWQYVGCEYRVVKRLDLGDTSVSFLFRSHDEIQPAADAEISGKDDS